MLIPRLLLHLVSDCRPSLSLGQISCPGTDKPPGSNPPVKPARQVPNCAAPESSPDCSQTLEIVHPPSSHNVCLISRFAAPSTKLFVQTCACTEPRRIRIREATRRCPWWSLIKRGREQKLARHKCRGLSREFSGNVDATAAFAQKRPA